MDRLIFWKQTKLLKSCLVIIILFSFFATGYAATQDIVDTYYDQKGWKLLVNGDDYFVKGVVWGYIPVGENYAYNLWAKSDDHIKNVLDHECNLMKEAGVNTIRSFGAIPPKWVTYIYNEYDIMTIMNHLVGRYGYTVNGAWKPTLDYSDKPTRQVLKKDILNFIKKYKNTPGVLMFALGNENNYSLEWTSFEIENLPEGERYKEKAKYLYSLYNEIMGAGKKIDSNHPFAIVNGDIQYLGLIAKYCKNLDILGVNAYRGASFTDMWERVSKELGLPVMLTEFGSDAFDVLDKEEDQTSQAKIVKSNWQEIYNKSYGNGEEGNAIGGLQFEWRDEWWKFKQNENLFIHDRHASWSNGGYSFDFMEGVNNMNEEWFGICRMGEPNEEGVYKAEPRMAYYVLKEIWRINPYKENKSRINRSINNIEMNLLSLKSDVQLIKSENRKREHIKIVGGSLQGDLVLNGKSEEVENRGKEGLEFSHGEMIFLDFEFQPTTKIEGNFTLNLLGNVVDKQLEQYYGKRGETFTTVISETEDEMEVTTTKEIKDNERVEIYSFEAIYNNKYFDLTTFYHVPRYHWGYDGDTYGLLWEATDMEGMDIWNAKAPYGFEFFGKRSLKGLTVVAGPEIYWGANPKAIVKYDFGGEKYKYSFIHSEDIKRAGTASTATEATNPATRQTALSLETQLTSGAKLELGYLFSGSEKIDDEFSYVDEEENIYLDKIKFEDTQGVKAKITFDAFKIAKIDASVNYAGLVADAGNHIREFDTLIPYSSLGNKVAFETGMLLPMGDVWLLPRFFYRENLIESNPIIDPYTDGTNFYPGLTPRNRDADPFAVLGNREAVSGELFVTYDPTPATYFYAWDNFKREDAPFAFSIGGNYTKYPTTTDAYLFYYQEGKTNASFGKGLPAEDLWLAKGRFIMNPNPNLMVITNIEGGKQQATGNPDGESPKYLSLDAKFVINQRHYISGYAKKNAWGPYDWYRQFNITFPYQFMLDYSLLIDNFLDELISSRIGFKSIFRTLDENSPTNEGEDLINDYVFQTGLYFDIKF